MGYSKWTRKAVKEAYRLHQSKWANEMWLFPVALGLNFKSDKRIPTCEAVQILMWAYEKYYGGKYGS
jgi:hypothetical protein